MTRDYAVNNSSNTTPKDGEKTNRGKNIRARKGKKKLHSKCPFPEIK